MYSHKCVFDLSLEGDIFWLPIQAYTCVICMGSGSATGFFPAVRLVHSLLKYFFFISVVILN